MNRLGFIAIPVLVLALLVACRAGGTDGANAPLPTERPPPEADVPATISDSLRLWLTVPERIGAGEPVPITLGVQNVSSQPIDLHLRGRSIAFDLIVADGEGAVVWSRLEDAVIPGILRIETLGAGRTLELEDTWDQRSNAGEPVAPGVYAVHGELLTEEEPLVTPAESLRIVSG